MAVADFAIVIVMVVERRFDTVAFVFALVGLFKTGSSTVAAIAAAAAFAAFTTFAAALTAALAFGKRRFDFGREIVIETDRSGRKRYCDYTGNCQRAAHAAIPLNLIISVSRFQCTRSRNPIALEIDTILDKCDGLHLTVT
jgi:hypothetical protein